MNYSLGNMLGGAGALNADKLSLNLQFAADKTLTARRGPTPTFTRASTATFVGSNGLIQSAAVNAARFDHDPVTLACKGLLIEESRTNLRTYSEDFSQAIYGKSGVTISSVSDTSPSGQTTVQKLVEDTSTGGHGVDCFVGSTGTQTLSVFAKADGQQWLRLNPLLIGNVWFDLQNGVLGTVQAGVVASITNYGNGWYRCSATATSVASSSILIRIAPSNNTLVYTGDGTSGILLWGAQLEAGSFPTSYIPTTTASVVRSVDLCSITGAAFTGFWNRFAGTCVIDVNSTLGATQAVISNSIAARALEIYATPTVIDFFEASGTQVVRIKSNPTYPNKIGLAYAINDYQGAYNGVLGGVDTNTGGTIPDATQLHIGNLGGTSNRLTGHIASIRYFKKRLSNAKLQALTV